MYPYAQCSALKSGGLTGKLKPFLDFLKMTNLKKPWNGLGLSDTIDLQES